LLRNEAPQILADGEIVITYTMNQELYTGIPSEQYTEDYYTRACHGYSEFFATGGAELPLRLSLPLKVVAPRPGMRVLDIGCGRGELAVHLARAGAIVWGLDYAEAAVKIARQFLAAAAFDDVRAAIQFLRGSALDLPLPACSVDAVTMLDVVEHLTPSELDRALGEVRRVLTPQGRLIIHTMPNLWYYRYGYPLYRLAQRMRGQQLPVDPRDRWLYKEVHVNEQTPMAMVATLRRNGFKSRVWLQSTQAYEYEPNTNARLIMRSLTAAPLLKRIFCNDIFAVGVKV
jgi:ubiquinone/menaquinone biosynthesis C-methylase UbiE